MSDVRARRRKDDLPSSKPAYNDTGADKVALHEH
jgi:hypothetical protein